MLTHPVPTRKIHLPEASAFTSIERACLPLISALSAEQRELLRCLSRVLRETGSLLKAIHKAILAYPDMNCGEFAEALDVLAVYLDAMVKE